jgi:hypothetical protein
VVERSAVNRLVVGSNPTSGAIFSSTCIVFRPGAITFTAMVAKPIAVESPAPRVLRHFGSKRSHFRYCLKDGL